MPTCFRARRGYHAGLVLSAVVSTACVVFASPAHSADTAGSAAVRSHSATSTCTGSTCDGREPNGTTCAQDARTVKSATRAGRLVELRYSPSCRAAWGRISGAAVGDGVDVANSNADSQYARVNSGSDAQTRMVNDAGLVSTSCGYQGGTTVLACTGSY